MLHHISALPHAVSIHACGLLGRCQSEYRTPSLTAVLTGPQMASSSELGLQRNDAKNFLHGECREIKCCFMAQSSPRPEGVLGLRCFLSFAVNAVASRTSYHPLGPSALKESHYTLPILLEMMKHSRIEDGTRSRFLSLLSTPPTSLRAPQTSLPCPPSY